MRDVKVIWVFVLLLMVFVEVETARADLADGLVAHWTLDEVSGDIAYDSAGSNNGTIYGAIPTTGQINGALDFDGVDDYVDCGNDNSLNIIHGLTVSAWIKMDSIGGYIAGWDKYPAQRKYLFYTSPGVLTAFIFKTDGQSTRIAGNTTLQTDTWYHVALTYEYVTDGTSILDIYLNGTKDATQITNARGPLQTMTTGETIIGWRSDAHEPGYEFDGTIDDVRIYNRALSDEEVGELYVLEAAELVGVEVVGPGDCAEDSQTQYEAIAHYDNGSTRGVTAWADWSVAGNVDCGIAAGLLATEMIDLPGDVTITAQYSEGAITASAEKDVSIFAICPSGSALEFDGVDDYVHMPYIDSYQIQALTFEAWVYPTIDSSLSGSVILGRGEDSDNDRSGLYLCIRKASSPWGTGVGIGYEDNSDNDIAYSTGYFPPTNTWTHLTVTRTPEGKLSIYADGALLNSWDSTPNISNSCFQELTVGALWAKSGSMFLASFFEGAIDEVAIYDRALTAEEIQLDMQTKPDTTEPSLVGYWDFDDGQGQVAADMSGNGNDGQLGAGVDIYDSDPNWVTNVPPAGVCSSRGLMERNLADVLDIKQGILDELDRAINKEAAAMYLLVKSYRARELGDIKRWVVRKSYNELRSAIGEEIKAGKSVDNSIEKINDAMDTVGIE